MGTKPKQCKKTTSVSYSWNENVFSLFDPQPVQLCQPREDLDVWSSMVFVLEARHVTSWHMPRCCVERESRLWPSEHLASDLGLLVSGGESMSNNRNHVICSILRSRNCRIKYAASSPWVNSWYVRRCGRRTGHWSWHWANGGEVHHNCRVYSHVLLPLARELLFRSSGGWNFTFITRFDC